MNAWIFKLTDGCFKSSPDDPGIEVVPRHVAEKIARLEAIREFTAADDRISYVAYLDMFDDYCEVTIRFDGLGNGTYACRLLPIADRLQAEVLDDAKIRRIALNGRKLNAIRLYRHLHGVGIKDAVDAVAELESEA
jgi:hypothetical protein